MPPKPHNSVKINDKQKADTSDADTSDADDDIVASDVDDITYDDADIIDEHGNDIVDEPDDIIDEPDEPDDKIVDVVDTAVDGHAHSNHDDADNEDDADNDIDDVILIEDEEEPINTLMYIVNDNDRMTSSSLTLAECTKVIGCRATHIDQGAPIFTDITNLDNVHHMALKELYDKKCPLKIRRRLGKLQGKNAYEEWKVNEMNLPAGFKKNNPI